jgi:predicted nucleic acid-binding protein
LVCLDTSFLVDLIRRDQSALAELKRIESDENSALTTTPISACELYEGAYKSKSARKEIEKVNEILRRIKLLDFSLGACECYGKLVRDLRSAGRPIGDLDTLIASIALTNNEPILTQNSDHFSKVPGLIVRTW